MTTTTRSGAMARTMNGMMTMSVARSGLNDRKRLMTIGSRREYAAPCHASDCYFYLRSLTVSTASGMRSRQGCSSEGV